MAKEKPPRLLRTDQPNPKYKPGNPVPEFTEEDVRSLATLPGKREGQRVGGLVYGIAKAVEEASPVAHVLKGARRYRNARQHELYKQFGEISAGVEMMLSSATLQLAASRAMFEAFALDPTDIEVTKVATKLAADARNMEMAAWDMAAKEMSLRKASEAGTVMPWERERGRPPSEPARIVVEVEDAEFQGEDEGSVDLGEGQDGSEAG
jgi:hypothetical protein